MTQLSLNTAIMSFAFSGVFAPHKPAPEAPRVVTQPTAKKK
jgi:hypothetical protein